MTGSLFYIILLIVVFIAGTFLPKLLKVREIEYNLETKYIEEANQLAYLNLSFAYETNEQFISAIKNCINFINLGLYKYERINRTYY